MGYQLMALERAFSDARDFCYDFVELWGGRPHAYAPDLAARGAGGIVRLSERYNMPVRVYTPEHNAYPFNYMLGDEEQRRDSMAYLKTALAVSKELGAEYMLVSAGHGGEAPEDERYARLVRSLGELAEEGERLSQSIVLEPLTPFESNTMTTHRALARVLEEVKSDRLFGMCDFVPPFIQGEDPADYARDPACRLRHLHIVDSDGASEDHLIPGEGKMPLRKIIGDFIREGYDGTATIELVTKYMSCQSRSARLAIEMVRNLI